MHITISARGGSHGCASELLLSNNIEVYENTVPSMLSDRLRNPKFSGPEHPQTGIAPEWEPNQNCMGGFSCRLVPGMYLSGREAQSLQNYVEQGWSGIAQHGVQVRDGEDFEVEIWARAQNRPVSVKVGLSLAGEVPTPESHAEMVFDRAHWHRKTCRIGAPGKGGAALFSLSISGDSRLVIDQVHLRPMGQTHVCEAMLEALERVPIAALRFPGGCISCTYHWGHGVGPVHLRPVCDDPVFKYKLHYDFGTDEYLDLCIARKIVPFITLNTSTDTPENAAAWAAYVRDYYVSRDLEIPTTYFMVGNENYGTHEIGHMTGEMYVQQLRDFVPGVRAAYPEARIAAIAEWNSSGIRTSQRTSWRSDVIQHAADYFDLLVVTRYSFARDRPLNISLARVAETVQEMAADLKAQAKTIRDAGLDRTMGIVEWNYWTRAGHNDHAGFYEPNDIRHCLYAAGYLNAMCRMGDVLEIANYYSLINTMGMLHVHDGQVESSDVARVFKLYQPALPGDVLEIDVDGLPMGEHGQAVDANFVRHGETVYGFLLNFSGETSVSIDVQGLGRLSDATGLTATNILSDVSEICPTVDEGMVILPPASFVRVTCS